MGGYDDPTRRGFAAPTPRMAGRGRQAVGWDVEQMLRLPVFGPWDSTGWVVGYDMLCPGWSY